MRKVMTKGESSVLIDKDVCGHGWEKGNPCPLEEGHKGGHLVSLEKWKIRAS